MSSTALRHKTLRIDVCTTSKSGREDCLVSVWYEIEQTAWWLNVNKVSKYNHIFFYVILGEYKPR